jgi:flagellar motor switch protein FliM
VVVVVGFELKMSNRAGTMNLCIPYNVIEPVIEDLFCAELVQRVEEPAVQAARETESVRAEPRG